MEWKQTLCCNSYHQVVLWQSKYDHVHKHDSPSSCRFQRGNILWMIVGMHDTEGHSFFMPVQRWLRLMEKEFLFRRSSFSWKLVVFRSCDISTLNTYQDSSIVNRWETKRRDRSALYLTGAYSVSLIWLNNTPWLGYSTTRSRPERPLPPCPASHLPASHLLPFTACGSASLQRGKSA
ncbi:hypothetical protein JOB18_004730 [Solea senegalensis]|uniref:Uncharacterized protein n=1 Tax=Solea senegalensis TaxID=28829 RepID=A0AAV6Q9R0_SOLSE|nr:hypothetical protein JOB18_004730 [Solea senegalensis]